MVNLVPAVLNRPCIVDADMSCLSGSHALVRLQHGVDDNLVGLGAARQEKDFRLLAIANLPDFFFRALAVFVVAVAGKRLPVRLGKTL